MATAIIEIPGLPTGLTLTCDLFPRGSDTAAVSGMTLTERTNCKTHYRTTTTAGLSGWHAVVVKLSGTAIGSWWVEMSDTATVHYATDTYPDVDRDVWNYASRTLTQTAAQVAAVLEGSSISLLRGDINVITITGMGSLAGRTKMWFTVKVNKSDADAAAVIQVEETDGLLYLEGSAPASPASATSATLVVDDEDAGDVTVTLKAAATSQLTVRGGLKYDFQYLGSDGQTRTKSPGTCTVVGDVTRAIS